MKVIQCRFSQLPSLIQIGFKNQLVDLIVTLQSLPASSHLPSTTARGTLRNELRRFISVVDSDEFDIARLFPLLDAIYDCQPDETIWNEVYTAVVESTPPPRSLPYLHQTPYLHTTSSFVNSSEHRKYVDDVLKEELGSIYVNVPGFYEAYFGDVDGLEEASAAVYRRCREGDSPLFSEESGWHDWPSNAKEKEVLGWLTTQVDLLRNIAIEEGFTMPIHNTVLTQPNQPLQGSTADRKLDVGFVRRLDTTDQAKSHWSHVLILGELKSNPGADTTSKTWRDLGRYAREVLTAQDTRRYALGFTLCGPIMRLWEFDRIGAIASSPFDINKDALQFVLSILGFLRMNNEQLGYDPSIMSSSDGKRFIEITHNGRSERLVLDGLLKRGPCVAGRATTCWKAHSEGDGTTLVIKDSWQYPEREEEGKLLCGATEKGVVNVARYYYHETVQVNGKVDDVRDNVRRGLDITQATNYQPTRPEIPSTASDTAGRKGHSATSAGRKRSSSRTGATLPPSKRTCSSSPSKCGHHRVLQNRVHRRVIIRDYGVPIYKAKSRLSVLSALESCIEGYESLHTRTGLLQGDISTGNLIVNDNDGNPSWPAFLIDLDLAIKEEREGPSGARGKTGTRAFMAIGLLLGEKHSFMHDLESFFWVLFWICIHYETPDKNSRVVSEFEKWNFVTVKELANLKKGIVADEGDFLEIAEESFTSHYEPLIPWVNKLRKVVFPNGGRWKKEDKALYTKMKDIFREAQINLDASTQSK